jgi:zinc and cadmium transporter
MSPLIETLVATLVAGLLSFLCAGLVALTARPQWVPLLVSYAIGALLGAVFQEILPHALSSAVGAEPILLTVLGGILLFFILEKTVLWRHDHGDGHAPPHEHRPHGRTGAMIVIGDSVHNFVDGVIISAAFTSDFKLGLITALAIIAHEIPQETGDFVVLLHGGLTRSRALLMNVVSSVAMCVGGLLGSIALAQLTAFVPYLLALAAASMIYVAVADLIPGLHQRIAPRESVKQVLLIALGILTIRFAHLLIGEI